MSTRIAVFDFDGTILNGDSYLRFLTFVLRRRPSRWVRAPLLVAGFALFATRRRNNEWLKTWFLNHVLAGLTVAREQDLVRRFIASQTDAIKSRALDRIGAHRSAGERVVLLSAGLDVYLRPWAESLGVTELLCTECARDAGGRLQGSLSGSNCRGPEKVRRLRGLALNGAITAYCDDESDLPLLLVVDKPVAIDPTPALRRICVERGIPIEAWRSHN